MLLKIDENLPLDCRGHRSTQRTQVINVAPATALRPHSALDTRYWVLCTLYSVLRTPSLPQTPRRHRRTPIVEISRPRRATGFINRANERDDGVTLRERDSGEVIPQAPSLRHVFFAEREMGCRPVPPEPPQAAFRSRVWQ